MAGAGADAYMALSGTSMAAGVTSGAVALLLDEKPRLTPAAVKVALQITSSTVHGEGLVTAGAGALNSVAAARFAAMPKDAFSESVVAEEATRASGIAFLNPAGRRQQSIAASSTIIWGNAALRGNTIIWGSADTIAWGSTNVWGSSADTIICGNTIIWGAAAETIHCGSADTIIWGRNVVGNTIVWGGSVLGSTIIWGSGIADMPI